MIQQQVVAADLHEALASPELQEEQQKLRHLREIRLQALRADLEPVVRSFPYLDLFSELIIQPSDSPRLWVDVMHYVEMEPSPNTYRFVQERGGCRTFVFETKRWDEMREYAARHLVKGLEMRGRLAAAETAPTVSESPKPRRWPVYMYACLLGLVIGALLTRIWPMLMELLEKQLP